MPAISPATVLLSIRQDIASSGVDTPSDTINNTFPGVPIVCAWPVSGQYGPGTRIVYYALIAACVLARNVIWLRKACLAAALLFPITAAVHAVVLASVHIESAVDMDIYGALQFCAIGVLVAPVSVRASKTYEKSEGRHIIFVWSAFLLAGLLSLVVEFYRSNPQYCEYDANGNNMTSARQWPYSNASFSCNVSCTEQYQKSPIRLGSSNNIYVIPAPSVVSFNAAMLIAAACCIPTVLLPASMWISILRQNYKKSYEKQEKGQGSPGDDQNPGHNCETKSERNSQVEHNEYEVHDGRRGAELTTGVSGFDNENPDAGDERPSVEEERSETDTTDRATRTSFQRYTLATVFGILVIIMGIVGEINLWSQQVNYMTDYMANVGQWAPLVGTGLAILGSGYVLLVQAMKEEQKKMDNQDQATKVEEIKERVRTLKQQEQFVQQEIQQDHGEAETGFPVPELVSDTDQNKSPTLHRVARAFVEMGRLIGPPKESAFESKDQMAAAQSAYPEIPGEAERSPNIRHVRTLSTSRRPSNESQHSNARRQRSNTAGSSSSSYNPDKERSSYEAASLPTLQKRTTLDVPNRRRSTQTTLPSPPITLDCVPSINSDGPNIVVSSEFDKVT